MSEAQKLFILAAAHQCEAALIMGDRDRAALAAEFAFFVANPDGPRGDHWS